MSFEIPNPLGNVTNASQPFDLNSLDLVPQANIRPKTISALYICIAAVGLIMNFALLFTLFKGGRKGLLFRAPSTILIINLGKCDNNLKFETPFPFFNFDDILI